MKRNFLVIVIVMSLLYIIPFGLTNESPCKVDVSILNQDPYPAVPGEKLEIVFVISNIDSNNCGEIEFEILEEFPFSVGKNSEKRYTIQSGTFTKDYNTQKTIPVDFVVDEDANDGDNPLEVRYKSSKSISEGYLSEQFDVNVEDVRADFEIFVSEYDYSTKEIKFEVLNIGKSDIEAVTVELLKEDGVKIYGSNIENIGDLSSNEDTSSEFKVNLSTDKIRLKVSYTDSINVRRSIEKEVNFDSSLFEDTRKTDKNYYWLWGLVLVIIILIYLWFRKRRKNKK